MELSSPCLTELDSIGRRTGLSIMWYLLCRPLKCLSFVAIVSLATACQTLPKPPMVDPSLQSWFSNKQYNQTESALGLSTWRYNAKIAIKTDTIKESANLVWSYHDQSNQLRLYGPFGAGAIKLHFDAYGVELVDNKGVVHRGNNAETLIYDLLGWPIPITSLSTWLFGQPDLNTDFRYRIDASNRINTLHQNGWEIEYSGYHEYAGQLLPRKIKARKKFGLGQQQDVEVILVTKAWQFGKDE